MRDKANKPKLSRKFFINMTSVAILSMVLLGIIWLRSEYTGFKAETEAMRKDFLVSHKAMIKNEVDKAVSYIEFRKAQTEAQLRESIKARVYNAHSIAMNIYKQYHGEKHPDEIKQIIKDVLKSIQFHKSNRSYFIIDLNETERKDILSTQDTDSKFPMSILNIANNDGEGFYRYTPPEQNNNEHSQKIVFVKLLEPLNWVIGTGEYLGDIKQNTQKAVLEFIEQIRYRNDGYIFAGQWDGISITTPSKGKNMWDLTDPNGLKLVQELIRLAKEGTGYLEYVMPKLEEKRPSPKLSYVAGIPEWKWYVGTGIYIDEIETAIAEKRKSFQDQIITNTINITLILIGLILLVSFIAARISRKTEANLDLFSNFFKKAVVGSATIDPNMMDFAELENIAYAANDMVKARKNAEEALKDSEEKYRKLFEHAGFSITLIDAETNERVEFNREAYERLGYSKKDYTNFELFSTDSEKDAEEIIAHHQEIIKKGYDIFEARHKTKNGDIRNVLISAVPIKIGGKHYIHNISADITEHKRLENQLQQAQKMESIGTLAGGIAHDFNNILAPIIIHSELAMMDLPDDSPTQHNLQEIFKAGERARDLVQQILTFSRKGDQKRVTIKITPILREALKMLRASIPTTIEIVQNFATKSDTVLADPTQINQIVLNLATNASYEMKDSGGILKVSLLQEDIDSETSLKHEGLKPGPYLKLTVSDTGSGIDNETIQKIFEPYFTTKEPGEGTGMGLALIHGIVKSYDGNIIVKSELGKGTTFNVYLPRVEKAIPLNPNISADLPKGTERILFIDDEKIAVKAIQPMLEKLGYRVTAKTDSLDALETFRSNPEAFDLVVTDMTMPGMTGKDLAIELMSIRPDIQIIICTGYSEQVDSKKAEELGIKAYLLKPTEMHIMANTIRDVLDKN